MSEGVNRDDRERWKAGEVGFNEAKRALVHLVNEVERLEREKAQDAAMIDSLSSHPHCGTCGVQLGDNWCGDCAGKATRERFKILAEGIAPLVRAVRGIRACGSTGDAIDAVDGLLLVLQKVEHELKRADVDVRS